jgi:hypothetical protein
MSRIERWSRRKLGNETPDEIDDDTVGEVVEESSADGHDDPPGASSASETDASREELSSVTPGSLDDTLPDPDTLPPGSDIKAFLEPGVSRGLRHRALRRLFSGDNYGIRDGLDDYDDDYREKLKPLARELAQRMRQWTRPVETPDDEEGEDGALSEKSGDTALASLEDSAADQESDEIRKPVSDSADAASEEVDEQSSPATLDEGRLDEKRIGVRHQSGQH